MYLPSYKFIAEGYGPMVTVSQVASPPAVTAHVLIELPAIVDAVLGN